MAQWQPTEQRTYNTCQCGSVSHVRLVLNILIILHKRLNLIDWHTLELKSSLKLSTKMVLNLKDTARFSLQKASIRKTRIRNTHDWHQVHDKICACRVAHHDHLLQYNALCIVHALQVLVVGLVAEDLPECTYWPSPNKIMIKSILLMKSIL